MFELESRVPYALPYLFSMQQDWVEVNRHVVGQRRNVTRFSRAEGRLFFCRCSFVCVQVRHLRRRNGRTAQVATTGTCQFQTRGTHMGCCRRRKLDDHLQGGVNSAIPTGRSIWPGEMPNEALISSIILLHHNTWGALRPNVCSSVRNRLITGSARVPLTANVYLHGCP